MLTLSSVGCEKGDDGAPSAQTDGGQREDSEQGSTSVDAAVPLPVSTGRCDSHNPLRAPFFGDTHVHTALSLDASLQGTRLRPSEAYRFARGERVGIQPYDAAGESQRSVQLDRPLDFVALSDHAEFLGPVQGCTNPDSSVHDSQVCVDFRESPDDSFVMLNAATAAQLDAVKPPAPCDQAEGGCRAETLAAWGEVIDAAEAAYDRTPACGFTSFVGYEWSSNPGTQNLHRNVIFANENVPELPTSYLDEPYVEDMWAALRRDCLDAGTGCDVLAIPHNSNLSNGLMFETRRQDGSEMDGDYARERAALEPLVEIFQHKGDSECGPELIAEDELCAFEKMNYTTLAGATLGQFSMQPPARDFLRHALGEGLRLQDSLGANPFRFGIVASTDTHLGTPGFVSEQKFAGHGGAGRAVRDSLPPGLIDRPWFNPGGLAVLWAEENSRESLFAAMRRREAYGTSGPRIVLRFFAASGLPEDVCDRADLSAQGYARGVPMGGTLAHPGEGLRFLVAAEQDPGVEGAPGTGLERVQVVKGWLAQGTPRFRVYDVAQAPGVLTEPAPEAACAAPVEGAARLCARWDDPDADPAVPAFYYVRVLERPSCRWHARACDAAGVDCSAPATVTEGHEPCCDTAYPRWQRERAWSSPIWLQPTGS